MEIDRHLRHQLQNKEIPLGEILKEKGFISLIQLEEALEISQNRDHTKLCRETSNLITSNLDKEKTIELLSKMISTDKIVHQKELFAYQIIAEEWGMYKKESD